MDAWRPKTWKVMGLLAALGCALLVIVACGGDDEDAPAPTAAPVDAAAIADQVAARLEQSMMMDR